MDDAAAALSAAEAAARAAYRAGGGDLDAALAALIGELAKAGYLPTGDPALDAPAAARRIAAQSGSPLYDGDGWNVLLDQEGKVWHAYLRAAALRAGDPESERTKLVRDRDLLLAYITTNTPKP